MIHYENGMDSEISNNECFEGQYQVTKNPINLRETVPGQKSFEWHEKENERDNQEYEHQGIVPND